MISFKYSGHSFREWKQKAAKYDKEFLIGLLHSMVRIRLIEEEIERQYSKDQMKTPIHLVIGQEATAVGACAALSQQDKIWCGHRTHGVYLAKGGNLRAMIAEMHCRTTGCAGSRGGSMHIIDKAVGVAGTSAIVGGIVPIAAGASLAAQMKNSPFVNVVFFGDAATEEGVVSETLNFAALKKLPLVFFCENNFYSVCTPLHERQPAVDIWKRSEGFGIPSIMVDGTNVLEVYEATKTAVDRAKKGDGPTFIEARVCRYRGHGGAGDDSHTGYRDIGEVPLWENQADPIEGFKQLLTELDYLSDLRTSEEFEKIRTEIHDAFYFGITSPHPDIGDLFQNVYSH